MPLLPATMSSGRGGDVTREASAYTARLWPRSPPVYILTCVNAQSSSPNPDQVALAVETLKMLADPTRVRILWALLHGEHSVGQLAEHVGANATSVSQHLAKLRLARLVRARREGTFVYYFADNEHVHRLLQEALFHTSHVLERSASGTRSQARSATEKDYAGDQISAETSRPR